MQTSGDVCGCVLPAVLPIGDTALCRTINDYAGDSRGQRVQRNGRNALTLRLLRLLAATVRIAEVASSSLAPSTSFFVDR
jgi:hypothetical protein